MRNLLFVLQVHCHPFKSLYQRVGFIGDFGRVFYIDWSLLNFRDIIYVRSISMNLA